MARNWPWRATSALREAAPSATVTRTSAGVAVEGSLSDHGRVAKQLLIASRGGSRPRTSPAPGSRQVYELRINDQPVGGVINALVKKFGWSAMVTPAASQKLRDPVSFYVKDASAEEVIAAAVKPAGLGYRLNGKQLQIFVVGE